MRWGKGPRDSEKISRELNPHTPASQRHCPRSRLPLQLKRAVKPLVQLLLALQLQLLEPFGVPGAPLPGKDRMFGEGLRTHKSRSSLPKLWRYASGMTVTVNAGCCIRG